MTVVCRIKIFSMPDPYFGGKDDTKVQLQNVDFRDFQVLQKPDETSKKHNKVGAKYLAPLEWLNKIFSKKYFFVTKVRFGRKLLNRQN